MTQVIEHIEVEVPAEKAYEQWSQFESFPEFLEYVEEIVPVDATHNHWKVQIGGVTREFDAEVVEQIENERIAWNSVGGEADHAGVVTFHRLSEDSSRVTVQLDWQPEGVIEKAGAAVGLDNHAVKKDLENFKEMIETTAGRTDDPDPDIAL